ncbi:polysaccharide deacetylase family protein [Exiguobacterium sp. SL14]|nr:polysaccharide deacetylase family protein [Exiguobacterium sp. SL14]MCY1691279.1 polysaccharide deacetylase family protein [Exiguobacterium sp. SL14]
MRSRLVKAGVLATLAYTVVPYMASRVFGWRVTKSLDSRYVALTFDDGPDPVYTAELLDLLQQEGIQATFFVVGHKAEAHPDIIRRIHEEGHQLGIHNYVHRPNWSMRPSTVREGIKRTAQSLNGSPRTADGLPSTVGRTECRRRPLSSIL